MTRFPDQRPFVCAILALTGVVMAGSLAQAQTRLDVVGSLMPPPGLDPVEVVAFNLCKTFLQDPQAANLAARVLPGWETRGGRNELPSLWQELDTEHGDTGTFVFANFDDHGDGHAVYYCGFPTDRWQPEAYSLDLFENSGFGDGRFVTDGDEKGASFVRDFPGGTLFTMSRETSGLNEISFNLITAPEPNGDSATDQ
ncbi:MAG: hypothetical protein AAGG69_14200 [Pseudomonadota bacterium]